MPQTNVVPAGQGGRTWVRAPSTAAGEQIRLVWGCGYVTLVDTTVELVDLGDGTAGASIPIPAEIADGGYLYCSLWEFAPASLPAAEPRAFVQWSNPSTWMVSVTHGVAGPPTDSVALRTNTPPSIQWVPGAGSPFYNTAVIRAKGYAAGQQVRLTIDCPVSGGLVLDAEATFSTGSNPLAILALPPDFLTMWNAAFPGDPNTLADRMCRIAETTPASFPAPNAWSMLESPASFSGGTSTSSGVTLSITHPAA